MIARRLLSLRAAKRAALISTFFILLLSGHGVFAHQQKAAITTIFFNPRTQNIEIMHRFYVHDAEHAVKKIWGKSADILQSETTQKQFAEYVTHRFHVRDNNNSELQLESIGFELEGQHFWVYQETAQPAKLEGLHVKHDVLRDIWSSQTNTVNIERLGDVETLTFDQNVELLSVTFN